MFFVKEDFQKFPHPKKKRKSRKIETTRKGSNAYLMIIVDYRRRRTSDNTENFTNGKMDYDQCKQLNMVINFHF